MCANGVLFDVFNQPLAERTNRGQILGDVVGNLDSERILNFDSKFLELIFLKVEVLFEMGFSRDLSCLDLEQLFNDFRDFGHRILQLHGSLVSEVACVLLQIQPDASVGCIAFDCDWCLREQDCRLLEYLLGTARIMTHSRGEWGDFVGRAVDIDRLNTALDSSSLVTLTGIGGVGKTRLALEVSQRRTSLHTHVVWLDQITEPQNLLPYVLAALGLAPTGQDDVERVQEFLNELQRPLLLLDNAEHLLDAVRADWMQCN